MQFEARSFSRDRFSTSRESLLSGQSSRTASGFRLPAAAEGNPNIFRHASEPDLGLRGGGGGRYGARNRRRSSRARRDAGAPPRTAPAVDARARLSLPSRPATHHHRGLPSRSGLASAASFSAADSGLLGGLDSSAVWGDQRHDTISQSLDSVLGFSTSSAPLSAADGDTSAKFKSIALYSQLKLAEHFKGGDGHDRVDGLGNLRPSAAQTAVCAHLLQELASVPSAFQDVLSQVSGVLLASVYSDQLQSGSIDMAERVPFYEVVERLQAEKDAWAARNAALQGELGAAADGERREAQGGLALRERCDTLQREMVSWKQKHMKQAVLIRDLEERLEVLEAREEDRLLGIKEEAPVEAVSTKVMGSKLAKAIADYKRASVRVEQLQYQLQFMVPRTELEEMTAERDRLEEELKEKTMAHRVLTLKFKKAFSDLMELRKKESERTPRPDWAAAAQLTNSAMDLDHSSHSTSGMVPVLCKKIAHLSRELERKNQSGIELNQLRSILDGTDSNVELVGQLMDGTYDKATLSIDPERPTHFIGQGVGLRVPRFLRQEGSVRNRNFKKSEIDKLVQDFWVKKRTYDEVPRKPGKDADTMAEYIYVHFMKIYGKDQSVVSEWTYSILDGLERFQAEEPHFRHFAHVVLGEISEHAYVDENNMVEALRQAVQSVSAKAKKGKKTLYVCNYKALEEMLRKFFPYRKQSDFTRMMRICLAISEEHKDKIQFELLFGSGRDLGKTEFLKLIKKQYLDEIMGLLRDLHDELKLRSEKGTDETMISVDAIRAAFAHVDRRKPKPESEEWILKSLYSSKHEDPLPADTAITGSLVVNIDALMRSGRLVFLQPTDQWMPPLEDLRR